MGSRSLLKLATIAAALALAFGCDTWDRTAGDDNDDFERRTVIVEMEAPDANWRLDIEEAYLVDGDIWVIAQLDRRSGMGAQVVTTVSDTATVMAPQDADVRVYLLGKTWNWGGEDYIAIESRDAIERRLDDAQKLRNS